MTSLERLLSRPQRNDLFRALEKSGAPVSEFRVQAGRSTFLLQSAGDYRQGVYILHDASGSFFLIEGSGVYSISGSIMNGDPSRTAVQGSQAFVRKLMGGWVPPPGGLEGSDSDWPSGWVRGNQAWDQVVDVVEEWAQAVIAGFREYEATPDLWTELQQSKAVLTASAENTLFTEAEQAEISLHMQQVRTFVSSVPELTADQLAEVNNRLDEMEEASRRLGRKDWLMLFNGAVFSLILTDAITPTVAQRIIMMGLQGLGHLFGIGGPPVPLP